MPTPSTLTKNAILRFIHDFQNEHNYPPTYREIAPAIGQRSWSTTGKYIREMVEEGILAARPNKRALWSILVSVPEAGIPIQKTSTPGRLPPREKEQPAGMRLLRFIREFQASKGYRPSIREMTKGAGFGSTATVNSHLRLLMAVGVIAPVGNNREPYRILIEPPDDVRGEHADKGTPEQSKGRGAAG